MKCFSKSLLPRRPLGLPRSTSLKSKLRISLVNDIIRKSFSSAGDEPEYTYLNTASKECNTADSLSAITLENEWFLLRIEEPLPSPRSKHAAVEIGRKMFVVGGTSADGLLGDVQVFNTNGRLWKKLWPLVEDSNELEGPGKGKQNHPSFSGHFVGIWKNQLIVVGSSSLDPKTSSVTVHAFDPSLRTWSTLNPTGEIPAARIGQRIIQLDCALVMFGGEDATGRILDDVCVLNLENLTWVSLQTTGVKPAPRKYHVAACHGGRYLWIYGGKSYATYYNDVFCLDLKTLVWTKEKTKGAAPTTARAGHVGAIVGNKFYIVGGENRGDEMVDTLVLNLRNREWSVLTTVHAMSPLAHDGVSVVRARHEGRHYLLAFGGHGTLMSCQMHAMLVKSATPVSTLSRYSSSSGSFESNSISASTSLFSSHLSSDSSRSLRRSTSLNLPDAASTSCNIDAENCGKTCEDKRDKDRERNLICGEEKTKDIEKGSKEKEVRTTNGIRSMRISKLSDAKVTKKSTANGTESIDSLHDNKSSLFPVTANPRTREQLPTHKREVSDSDESFITSENNTQTRRCFHNHGPGTDDVSDAKLEGPGIGDGQRARPMDPESNSSGLVSVLENMGEEVEAQSLFRDEHDKHLLVSKVAEEHVPHDSPPSSRFKKEDLELAAALNAVRELQQQVHILTKTKEKRDQNLQKKFRNIEIMARKLEVSMMQQMIADATSGLRNEVARDQTSTE